MTENPFDLNIILSHKGKEKKLRGFVMLIIRNERIEDYETVEQITRRAFYNRYMPGCTEHYLVHIMRSHQDFIPELDFVAEMDGQVIGNIMYTKAMLTDESGTEKETLTFGPVSISPEYQRMGYGKQLMEHSFQRAVEMGYDSIVIFGSPANYVSRGFQSCKKFNVCVADSKWPQGRYPAGMLVKELIPGVFDGRKWFYRESPVMNINEQEAQSYDQGFEALEKKYLPSQEEFYIISNSFVE